MKFNLIPILIHALTVFSSDQSEQGEIEKRCDGVSCGGVGGIGAIQPGLYGGIGAIQPGLYGGFGYPTGFPGYAGIGAGGLAGAGIGACGYGGCGGGFGFPSVGANNAFAANQVAAVDKLSDTTALKNLNIHAFDEAYRKKVFNLNDLTFIRQQCLFRAFYQANVAACQNIGVFNPIY